MSTALMRKEIKTFKLLNKKQKAEYVDNVLKMEQNVLSDIENILSDNPYAKSIVLQHLHERNIMVRATYEYSERIIGQDPELSVNYCAKNIVYKTFYAVMPTIKEKNPQELANNIIENWNTTHDIPVNEEMLSYFRGYVKYLTKNNGLNIEENNNDISVPEFDENYKKELEEIIIANAQ